MLSDFSAIMRDLPPRDARVYCISDVHIGARESDIEGFSRFCKELSEQEDSYAIFAGDILNNAVKDSLSNVYDEVLSPSQAKAAARECIAPLAEKGKILCMVMGNHEFRSAKAVDLDPLYDVACLLGIEEVYRRYMAFLQLTMSEGKTKNRFRLCVMHGASQTKKRNYHIEGIDAFITGHTHAPLIERPAHLVFNSRGQVKKKEVLHITAPSWLEYGGYAAQKMYRPQSTSYPQALLLKWAATNCTEYHKRITVEW